MKTRLSRLCARLFLLDEGGQMNASLYSCKGEGTGKLLSCIVYDGRLFLVSSKTSPALRYKIDEAIKRAFTISQ